MYRSLSRTRGWGLGVFPRGRASLAEGGPRDNSTSTSTSTSDSTKTNTNTNTNTTTTTTSTTTTTATYNDINTNNIRMIIIIIPMAKFPEGARVSPKGGASRDLRSGGNNIILLLYNKHIILFNGNML